MMCKYCLTTIKHRDYVSRIVKYADGKKLYVKVERFICPTCSRVSRVLPYYIIPYKHYDARIIYGVQRRRITYTSPGFEDYPCEMTMKRWIKEYQQNTLL